VTPGGASLLACTILDALRGGFDQVAVVVRREIRDEVAQHLHAHLGSEAPLRWVLQPQPLGTAHALLLAARELGRPPALAMANGDDLYGPNALALLAAATRNLAADAASATPRAALVGYSMAGTLSPRGGVSRGWVEVESDGPGLPAPGPADPPPTADSPPVAGPPPTADPAATAPDEVSPPLPVRRVRECLEVRRTPPGIEGRPVTADGAVGDGVLLPEDAVASMNLWALDRRAVELVEERFRRWRRRGAAPNGGGEVDSEARAAEFSLAPVLNGALESGELSVTLDGMGEGWIGLTFPGDLAAVRAHLAALQPTGRYPHPLARGLPWREDGGCGGG
jgi:hypothetical protein